MNTVTINSYTRNPNPHLKASRDREKCLHENVNDGMTAIKTAKKNIIKREPADVNFCGFLNSPKMEKLYTNPKFHKILKLADAKQAVFQASFALILTCILRPASIMVLPTDKKNKGDGKYASAHSIASGVIGYAFASILLAPFTNGINKFTKDMGKYVKKENFLLQNKAARDATGIYFGRLTDWVPAIPKGILTVALIPPILKYVFGMEKKKVNSNTNGTLPIVDYSLLNFQSANKQKGATFQNFEGGVK